MVNSMNAIGKMVEFCVVRLRFNDTGMAIVFVVRFSSSSLLAYGLGSMTLGGISLVHG